MRFSFCIVPAIIVYTSRAHGAKLNTPAAPRTHTARGRVHCVSQHAATRARAPLPPLGGFYASATASNDGRGGGRAITNICSLESTCTPTSSPVVFVSSTLILKRVPSLVSVALTCTRPPASRRFRVPRGLRALVRDRNSRYVSDDFGIFRE